jgi:hypothetical protein
MKKIVLSLVVVAFLASCKKDYTCTCPGLPAVEYTGLNKSDADKLETSCETGNICTWAKK